MKTLAERLDREMAARRAVGLPSPQGRFSEEDLRELTVHAESSRDAQLLGRVYKIESAQALGDARAAGDSTIVRRLEEKYVGLKLEAEVHQHRAESSLTWAQEYPTKIMLPTKDDKGRDIVTSLDAWHHGKGIKGALRKMTESRDHREFREKLEATKDSYLLHQTRRLEKQTAYLEALRAITSNCRELSRACGFRTPSSPELTPEKIQEIRDYAVKQSHGVRGQWLRECTQAQELLNDRQALAYQSRQSDEVVPSEPYDPTSVEKIRKQIAEGRAQQERMIQAPVRNTVNPERQNIPIDPNREGQTPPRSEGARGRGR